MNSKCISQDCSGEQNKAATFVCRVWGLRYLDYLLAILVSSEFDHFVLSQLGASILIRANRVHITNVFHLPCINIWFQTSSSSSSLCRVRCSATPATSCLQSDSLASRSGTAGSEEKGKRRKLPSIKSLPQKTSKLLNNPSSLRNNRCGWAEGPQARAGAQILVRGPAGPRSPMGPWGPVGA